METTNTAPVRRKKNRIRPRFYSIILSLLIFITVGIFIRHHLHLTVPNFHGWEGADVIEFAQIHQIQVNFTFVYDEQMSPTKVTGQSVAPRTELTADMVIDIEISKGIEVR